MDRKQIIRRMNALWAIWIAILIAYVVLVSWALHAHFDWPWGIAVPATTLTALLIFQHYGRRI